MEGKKSFEAVSKLWNDPLKLAFLVMILEVIEETKKNPKSLCMNKAVKDLFRTYLQLTPK